MKYSGAIKLFFSKIIGRLKDPVFIIALLISSLLWLLTKLNDTYTSDVTVVVNVEGAEIENSDRNGFFVDDNEVNIGLRIRASGYNIIGTYFSNLEIPAEDFISIKDNLSYSVDMSLFERELSGKLKNVEILKLFNKTIPLRSVVRLRKEVPIKDNISLSLSGEYTLIGKPTLEPSTVWISGSKRDIENINSIQTQPYTINKSNKVSGNILLQSIPNIYMSEKEVFFTVTIERYTEIESKNIPIHILNPVKGEKYILLPSTIDVTYNVTENIFRNFKNIVPKFYVCADSIKNNKNYLGKNTYLIQNEPLPKGLEVRMKSSDRVIVLKSR
ncbi:MAG: hypothetical protein IMY73_03710 [Bacteroidetes bacterium]|nr:hypothetical protein [Bacteroidota bacterium]